MRYNLGPEVKVALLADAWTGSYSKSDGLDIRRTFHVFLREPVFFSGPIGK